jgi:tetratricopeptide (TPR) repeat protein
MRVPTLHRLLLALLLGTAWFPPGRAAALHVRPDEAPRAAVAAPSSPVAAWEGELSALEMRLFADAADGRLDRHTLLSAALVAGGADRAESIARYEAQVRSLGDELVAGLERAGELRGSPRRRAERVLEFLHRRVLAGGYDITASDLRLALDEGRFNCVTASVLFNCLAERAGLLAVGLEMPGHAMSRVILPDGPLDVETTCAGWLRLSGDPRRQAQQAEATLGASTSPDRSLARPISDIELCAMIYYNRGVDYLAEQHFAEAAAANAKALRLNPGSDTARGNLLATINNWAIALGTSGRYAEAAELLRRGIELDPRYETFLLNAAHVYHQWVLALCRNGRYDEALRTLERGAEWFPQVAYLRAAPAEVHRLRAGEVSRQP